MRETVYKKMYTTAWRDVAEALRPLTPGQLRLAERFLHWVVQQEL